MKLINALVMTGLISLSCHAQARISGGESSGGGTGIVCRNLRGQITQAVSLDLYEVMAKGAKMKTASGDIEKDYASLFLELRKAMADTRPIGHQDIEFLRTMLGNFIFVKQTLPSTHDTGTLPENLPSGCQVEQVIIANDPRNKFTVNEEIWNALDSLDKAAFVIHEFTYQIARITSNEKTSERVRPIVGVAASEHGLENAFGGATPGHSVICRASVPALGSSYMTSDVVIYDNPQNSSESIILLTRYFGFMPMFRMAHRIPKIDTTLLVPEKISDALGVALVVKDPKAAVTNTMYTGQKNLAGEFYSFTYSYNSPFTFSKLAPNPATGRYEATMTGFFRDCHTWEWKY